MDGESGVEGGGDGRKQTYQIGMGGSGKEGRERGRNVGSEVGSEEG